MNSNIKYFLYARKSTEGEDRQITSIEDQISEVSKLAKELNIEIVDVISESKSAKEPGRKEFNQMLSRIEKGEAQGILCWKLNRLARNPIDGGRISWMLQENIIQHIQTYGRDYKPTDNVIMMSVEFGMSNQYVKDLSVDVKRGMRKKAERGWYPTACLPIGYIHNPIKNGNEKIIIDDVRYRIVKKLWKYLLTGLYSLSDIKRKADKLNLVNKYGNHFSLNTFSLLFSNEFYSGHYYWNNKDGHKVRHLGKHKPMISELEFRTVQKILGKNRNFNRKRDYFFPYRGLLSCGECKGSVTAENKHQAICTQCKYKYSLKTNSYCPKCKTDISEMTNPSIINKTYYHCTKKVNKNCTQGSITEKKIEDFIENHLLKTAIKKDYFDFALKGLRMLEEDENIDEEKALTSLKKRRTELETRTNSLLKMRADGEITSEQLHQMKSSTKNEVDKLTFKILSIEHLQSNWFKITKDNFIFLLKSPKQFQKGDKKARKEIFSKIGSNLTLKDKSLYFKRDLALVSICHGATAYMEEKSRVEPKIPIVNKGDFNDFELLFPKLLGHLRLIRTYQIDNLTVPNSE